MLTQDNDAKDDLEGDRESPGYIVWVKPVEPKIEPVRYHDSAGD
jgi:hypothetical protein